MQKNAHLERFQFWKTQSPRAVESAHTYPLSSRMPLVCFISGCKSSYPELEVLHPLPYHFILWGRGVGHLELEQVIASWSIAILVKHNRGAGTACAEQSKREDAKKKERKSVRRWCGKTKNKKPFTSFLPTPWWPTRTKQRSLCAFLQI